MLYHEGYEVLFLGNLLMMKHTVGGIFDSS